jgi:hypothetical protein
MKPVACLFLFGIFLTYNSCKKDNIKVATISGKVTNIASGDPVSKFWVYLETITPPKHFSSNSTTSSESVMTDSNGNFTFSDVNINENSGYHYDLWVYGCTGKGCNDPPGTISYISIDKSNILNSYELKVLPRFQFLNVKLDTNSSLTFPDSVAVIIKNKINFPPYPPINDTLTSSVLRNGKVFSVANDNIACKFYFNIFKKKNNISSYSTDSIYMNNNDVFTYTVNY